MNSSWLIPMFLGLNSFGGFNTTLYYCIGDYNRFSKRYERYGVDE